ncbi:MAG: glycoside hydrolase family 3 C-terminal domain-containing protein [Chitinispirillia bacterium]|nr:glycoside hydrolase family 3 C-terminal domain-containing protein [Chitinispirillia bacterium]
MQRVLSLKITLLTFVFICLLPINAMAQLPSAITLTGKVTDIAGAQISDAVVMVKTGDNLLAHFRTLTNAQGDFGPSWRGAAIEVADGGQAVIVIRKAGYLPFTLQLVDHENFSIDLGSFTLVRDPIERRIDSVMAMMSTAEKIAQMTQPELGSGTGNTVNSASTGGTTGNLWGSVLNGGSGYTSTFLSSMVTTLNSWPAGRARIPTYYGKDAVHGNAGIPGYTVFPHNIGLGAARDSALVRRIGEATAKQLWAANIDLNFSPAISVARDLRWGRAYESYGYSPELSVMMGAAMVRGLQGERFDAPWRITATAKHFLGDGGTTDGADRGNTPATDEELRAIHMPGYEAVVEQGVLSVMASFNTIRNVHQHIDSLRMTGWLKTELGFDGYIISDWEGIANSNNPGWTDANNYSGIGSPTAPQLTLDAVRRAINGGIDLAMEPGGISSGTGFPPPPQTPNHLTFRNHLTTLVNNGSVSEERINDAVRRILRAKFRAGRMDNPVGPTEFAGNTANRASAEQRALAREAVAKSQVLLKNNDSVLPLTKTAGIHVFGSHHDNIGRQCGGWTIVWQGISGNSGGGTGGTPAFNFTNYGNSILSGIRQVAPQATISASAAAPTSTNAGIIVYVTGENPYAEWNGDITTLNFPIPAAANNASVDAAARTNFTADTTALRRFRNEGKKVVTIFVSGRPRIIPQLIDVSDAFIAAWLPGTEGAGVADVLFGDRPFTGKLPFAWPGSSGTQFAYGFGLTTGTPTSVLSPERAVPSIPDVNLDDDDKHPSAVTINEFTAGPNPVSRSAGAVTFFWQGKETVNATLSIYDASGSRVSRIRISDKSTGKSSNERRPVGSWDFTNSKGRAVSEGNYAVKGNIKTKDGKREKVSLILGVK